MCLIDCNEYILKKVNYLQKINSITLQFYEFKDILDKNLDDIDIIVDCSGKQNKLHYLYYKQKKYVAYNPDNLIAYTDILFKYKEVFYNKYITIENYLKRKSEWKDFTLPKGSLFSYILKPILEKCDKKCELDFIPLNKIYFVEDLMGGEYQRHANIEDIFASVHREFQTYKLNNELMSLLPKQVKIYNFNSPIEASLLPEEQRRFQQQISVLQLRQGGLTEELINIFGIRKDGIEEYVDKILDLPKLTKSLPVLFQEFDNKIFCTRGGVRITVGCPEKYANTIWIIGACSAFGAYSENGETIESYLQGRINCDRFPYRVINLGSFYSGNICGLLEKIELLDGDIIVNLSILPMENRQIRYYDLSEIFQDNNREEYFIDSYNHYNFRANKLIADKIFRVLSDDLSKNLPQFNEHNYYEIFKQSDKWIDSINKEEIIQYISSIDISKIDIGGYVGSIVMNCNPFTLGHKALIEWAANTVDELFVFVVEEDKSAFRFSDRINMVKLGTAHIKNVHVFSSGRFMISAQTFPEYFTKDSQPENVMIDPSLDIRIFGKYIAPAFNIKVRFAGEEPIDQYTKQYNRVMEKILPEYGVKFKEIKRTMYNNEVISASRVRHALKMDDFDTIKSLVPESTLNYLQQYENLRDIV